MISYFRIRKYGKFHILPITTAFCVSKDGIEALGISFPQPLWMLKPGDIEPKGIEAVQILEELAREYRRLTRGTDCKANVDTKQTAEILKSRNRLDLM